MRWIVGSRQNKDIIEQILLNRGIAKADQGKFLQPDFSKDLANPFKLKGMKEAVKILLKARKQKQKIGIFTDYDADGIPAAALISRALDRLKIASQVYIPHRQSGYGLSQAGIDSLIKLGCQVLLTLDLGTTAREEIGYAKSQGLSTIVIDHHLASKAQLPLADSLINPKQKDCPSVDKNLSAGGLAYKLVMALAQKTGLIGESQLKWWLDLPAISTITDIVPLIGENRVIAKFGLIVLSQTRNIGLQELIKVSGFEPENMSTYAVGFGLGPRINAPGRLFDPKDAYELLKTQDRQRARQLSRQLDQINLVRQQEMSRALDLAIQKIEKERLDKNKIILVTDKSLKPGIVGLVAGKLTEKYCRPAIVLQEDGGMARGSARSIEDFHLIEALDKCQGLLSRHGGHARAAGLALEMRHLAAFYDQLLTLADKKLTVQSLIPQLKIDGRLEFGQLTLRFFRQLEKLEPFGFGNPRPVFVTYRVVIEELKTVGSQGQHLKLRLAQGGQRLPGERPGLPAIGFGLGEKIAPAASGRNKNLKKGKLADIAYSLDLNQYQGQKMLQLKLLDLKPNQ